MSVTIFDVAKKCNVSPSTVSKVFNGIGSEKMREKVLKTAEELGYKKRTSSPKHDSMGSILVVVTGNAYTSLGNIPFYGPVIAGIEQSLVKHDLQMRLSTVPSGQEDYSNQIKSILDMSEAKGVIVVGGFARATVLKFKESGLPMVMVNYNWINDGIDSVVSNNKTGTHAIVQYLLQLGHRHIAFIGGPRHHAHTEKRYIGYRTALEQAGVKENPHLTYFCDTRVDIDQGYTVACDILKQREVTAFFCDTDMMALSIMKAIQESGYKVPQDISVAGFDDVDMSQIVTPSLTTVRVHKQQMGEYAVERLTQIIQKRNKDFIPITIVLPTELVVRKSTADVRTNG